MNFNFLDKVTVKSSVVINETYGPFNIAPQRQHCSCKGKIMTVTQIHIKKGEVQHICVEETNLKFAPEMLELVHCPKCYYASIGPSAIIGCKVLRKMGNKRTAYRVYGDYRNEFIFSNCPHTTKKGKKFIHGMINDCMQH